METELGRIASLISEAEVSRAPLQQRLASFGKRLCSRLFHTHPLSPTELAVAFGSALVVFGAVEAEQAQIRRGRPFGLPASTVGAASAGGRALPHHGLHTCATDSWKVPSPIAPAVIPQRVKREQDRDARQER